MDRGRAWRSEYQKASAVWPESVRPERSVIVPEIITGQRAPCSANIASSANSAAFAFSVSKMVSTISTSAPPSASDSAASRYCATRVSKSMLRKAGSLTSGEIDAVRGVGPSTPTTKRGFAGSRVSNSVQTALASLAASRFSSGTRCSSW